VTSGVAGAPPVMQVLHQGGGSGSVTSTLHLSIGLLRAGWPVRFVCPPDSEVEALAAAAGLEPIPLRLLPRSRRQNAAALAGLIRRVPVGLVNSQSARDREALTWLALTRRLPVPFVATRRQMPRTFPVENWLTGRLAARIIAVSRPVAEALVRRGTPRRKLVVVPNGLVTEGVDTPVGQEALDRWRQRIGWRPDQRTIGIVSRPKDQAIVLRALERVAAPVRIVLAGVDPRELAAPIRKVPARHAVVALPFTGDVRPLYDLLEVVLLPSRMEGLSQAALEAMALGKPVAVSAAGGNLDLVSHESDGLLVPATDPAAWASAIERLLGDADLRARLGASGKRTARERFSLAETVRRTARVYQDVLRCPPAAPGANSPVEGA
jgi:glycosyltransferase involved in cell wall biosynthesis